MVPAFAGVVQYVPHITEHDTVGLTCRNLPPELCRNNDMIFPSDDTGKVG
jgi:hypothetical protein